MSSIFFSPSATTGSTATREEGGKRELSSSNKSVSGKCIKG